MKRKVLLDIPNDLYVVAAENARQRRMMLEDYLLEAVVLSMTLSHDSGVASRLQDRRRKGVGVSRPGVAAAVM